MTLCDRRLAAGSKHRLRVTKAVELEGESIGYGFSENEAVIVPMAALEIRLAVHLCRSGAWEGSLKVIARTTIPFYSHASFVALPFG